jgi:hypothetical protein
VAERSDRDVHHEHDRTCRISRKLAKSRASIVFTVTKITAGVGP